MEKQEQRRQAPDRGAENRLLAIIEANLENPSEKGAEVNIEAIKALYELQKRGT